LLDANSTGLGKWEASDNRTAPAIDRIPKDVVICDWHYDRAPDTIRTFAERGFSVVGCPWRKPDVALAQLEQVRALRMGSDADLAARALGMVQTTWCGPRQFITAYNALSTSALMERRNAAEAALCFQTLFKAIRAPEAVDRPSEHP
jgi:hypothetical protein